MFTSLDKAIVAFIASGAFIFTSFSGIEVPISDGMLSGIGMLVTAGLVYFVPNKPANAA